MDFDRQTSRNRAPKTRVCTLRVAGKTGQLSLGHRYRSATSSPALGALLESLWPATKTTQGLGTETTQVQFPKLACDWFSPCEQKFPLRPNSKTGSENEGMPLEGCRQNRSTVPCVAPLQN